MINASPMDYEEEDEVASYPPWNFSWVVKKQLAVMSYPQNEANLRWIQEQGIQHLVTLSREKRPPLDLIPSKIKWTEIAVEEFEAPTMAQIKKFIEICQRAQIANEIVGVHCRQGQGRSGVMAACYLVHFQDLAPERAIINLRMIRPYSIETPEQERAVVHYHDVIRGVRGTY